MNELNELDTKPAARAVQKELAGKVAVVTGGTRGIGRAAVELFARAGASIAICARDETALVAATREIEKDHNVPVLGCRADILDVGSVEGFMRQVGDKFGRIDMLVNNAGGSSQRASEGVTRQIQVTDSHGDDLPAGRFESMKDDEFRQAFEQKLLGMVRVTRAALPLLRQSDAGAIVNIASTKGLQPTVRVVTSGIAWAAVFNFSKSLSFELAPSGIRVNVLCVDIVVTSQTEKSRSRWESDKVIEEFMKTRSAPIPLGRLASAGEAAEAIFFLASPRSSYITGQCLAMDGGGVRCV